VLAVPASYSVKQKEEALKAVAAGAGVGGVEVIDDASAALVAAKFTGAMGPNEDEHFDRPWAVVDVGGLLSQVRACS
jgi:molecular chaperone DnaK (HSP70)